jgi:xyloglucan galactosyltransferase MUR3
MYALPEQYWWRWPKPGTDCSGNGYVGHNHAENSGMGPIIRPDDGLFLTWHFSLFSSLWNRMKRSSRRTRDPEKASIYIIPYDLGLDGYLNQDNCANSRRCTYGMANALMTNLTNSKYYQRYKGADHVLLWSLGQYHPWPHNGCDQLMRDTCELCTITCYWMDPTKGENRFVSMPFPSSYHWHDDIVHIPWDYNPTHKRNLTAVYLGSTQTLNPAHTKIRRAMTQQCESHEECHWLKLAHSSKDDQIADFLSVYRKSTFCLCPPGDDPARKAVFDAILSGCIPVIFEVATLYNQYPWHIGEQTARDISIGIPGGQVRSHRLKFMDVLMQIPLDVIRKKQRAIAKAAPRIQYSSPPIHLLKDKYDETTWDPPFPDGVDAALDGMFNRAARVINKQKTGVPYRLQTGKEWGAEYDKVLY